MAGKLNLIFSNKFDLAIWKYVISDSGKFLAFELRSENSDEIKFLFCDLIKQNLVEIKFNQADWWTTLYEVDEQDIYFKKYHSEGNPEIQSVLKWSNTAQTVKELPKDTNIIIKRNRLLSPSLYTAENVHYQTLSTFIKSVINIEPNNRGIEYLEWSDKITLSYYTGDKSMANFLLIVNDKKEVDFHECIGKDLSGIGQDTFSVDDNKLIFVKDNCEIFIYQHD